VPCACSALMMIISPAIAHTAAVSVRASGP
jgi:hypothetical protein